LNKALILSEKSVAPFTDKLIAVGNLVKKEFLDARICDDSKIEVIYSAIDFDKFDVDVDIHYKKKSLGIASDALVIGTVGHLVTCKGHKYFIQAASQLVRVFPNICFIIVGEGPLKEELENQISHLNLASTVKLLENREDVPEILSIMDVYVQPSLWEGLPRTIVEAMYMKRPVIASSVNAIPELIEDGNTGILVPPKDVLALANAIESLLENPDERKRLGENAYRRVFPEFSADLMVDKIENLYLRLLAEKLPGKLSGAV
jgi:glycosyltransferase involved in cell wall biosynthesis